MRSDLITSLALRLKRDQLSADDFQREMAALSREERASLVEYLNSIDKGPVEISGSGRYRQNTPRQPFA